MAPTGYLPNGTTSVYVYDLAGPTRTSTLTTTSGSVKAAVSPDGAKVGVTIATGKVQFIDTAAVTIGTVLSLTIPGTPALNACCWSPDSTTFWVQNNAGGTNSSLIPVIWASGGGGSQGTTIFTAVSSANNQQIAISPDGTTIYAATQTVCRAYTLATGVLKWTSATFASTCQGIAVSPDGTLVYAATGDSTHGLLFKLNASTGATINTGGLTISNNPGQMALSGDGATLWIPAFSTTAINRVATASMTLTHTPTVGASPYAVTMQADGAKVWVATLSGSHFVNVDTTTMTAGTAVAILAGNPQIVAVTPPPVTPPGVTSSACAVAVGPVLVEVGSGGSAGHPPVITSITITGTATLNVGPLSVTVTVDVETRVGAAAVTVGPVRLAALGGRTGPGAWPVPGFRGRWRLTLHARAFAPATLNATIIAELSDARGRQLVQAWDTPATLTFTLDGRSQSAALIQELLHDVVAWRWDDQTGLEQAVFRGPITQSQDTLDGESHTVTYTCHDYAAMLTRRILTSTYTVTARDQDLIVGDLLTRASTPTTSSGTALSPAAFLPVGLLSVDGAGTLRGLSGQLRDRTYYASQNVGAAVDDLAKVINGYDYDVIPSAVDDHDSLRVFYPAQGVARTDMALQYGSTVSSLTRAVDSSTYANYVRVLGNNQSTNPTPQLYAEAWDPTAASITTTPVGLWMDADDASDATVQATLNDKAAGDLNLATSFDPAYTLTMTPNAYTWGHPNMGDIVPLIIASGRLDVTSTIRVLGITYLIGDDGQEDVSLTCGRVTTTLAKLFRKADRDTKALARR